MTVSKNPFRLAGSTVAVIGAGSGIGEGAAEACGRQGALVACFDVNLPAAQATADRIVSAGGQAVAARTRHPRSRSDGVGARGAERSAGRGGDARSQCPQAPARLPARGVRPGHHTQPWWRDVRVAGRGTAAVGRRRRQHRAAVFHPLPGRRAGAGRLRGDQGGHRPACPHRRGRTRPQRGAGERAGAGRHRHAPDQADPAERGPGTAPMQRRRRWAAGAVRTRSATRRHSWYRTPRAT